jgi:lipoprotein NlpI
MERGRLPARKGDFAKAEEDFSRGMELEPESPVHFYNRGVVRYGRGLYALAIEDFSHAIELDNTDPESFNNRGSARLASGELDEAIRDYNRAIEIRDGYARALANRGVAFFYKGDFTAANADFSGALRLDPSDGMAFHNRGIVRYLAGDRKGSLADFNSSIAIDPRNAYSRIWRLAVSGERAAAYIREERARYAGRSAGWPETLIRSFLGLVSERELFRRAAEAREPGLAGARRAEAYYYLGLRRKTIAGGKGKAVDYFRNSLESDAPTSHARRLARYELFGE